MNYQSQIRWKEYPVWKPQHPGYFLAIQNGIVGAAFYSFGASSWKTFMSSTDEVKADNVTHWAYFPDVVPIPEDNLISLTKQQWIRLSNIFHEHCSEKMWVVDFPTVVEIVEQFLSGERPVLDGSESIGKETPVCVHCGKTRGHMVQNDRNEWECPFCKEETSDEYLDGSKPIGGETPDEIRAKHEHWVEPYIESGAESPDEYLDRLIKEASPAWKDIDPEKFLDEARGRVSVAIESEPYPGIRARVKSISEQINQLIAECGGDPRDAVNVALARLELAKRKISESPFDEAINLLRALYDLQNGCPLEKYRTQWEKTMAAVNDFLQKHEQV